MKKKKIWMNVAKSFKEAEEFDIKFWKSVSAEGKFSAMWSIVKDFYHLRGKSGNKRRLQRSVQNIKRA
ncbi:MAG: hypothetical protein ISS91_02745 [Candidatus Omnitrophica bacterium]|nr:hypothetical protein [Candidatus Omnitrophota bacterium]